MTEVSWPDWLAGQAAEREAAGLTRALRPRPAVDDLIDLAGNDYLGLSKHPAVVAAAAEAAMTWGGGAGASRLVTGSLELHRQLETELAEFTGRPAALLFSSGYTANLGVVAALGGRDAFIVSDAHVHASLVDAVRLSRAEYAVVPHNDPAAVERALAEAGGRRALVLVESIYSVLGDAAPLVDLAEITADASALLIVDEAHALGVQGIGSVTASKLATEEHVISTGTLSKAFGSQGGVVLGSQQVVDHLVNVARPFIFDTGLAPAAVAAALAALHVIDDEHRLIVLVARRAQGLAGLLGVPAPAGAVLSLTMPSPAAALAAQAAALAEGVRVGCFRPPSVPDGISRLRITVSAGVSDADWARACDVVAAVVKEHG